MHLTDDEMWEALVSCNERYDGQFFYAVKTVGVYCRPSCKSRTPLRKNVSYFLTKNDALQAGFRPCKRCRPDLMEYDPAEELVRQAKELIDQYYFKREQLKNKMKQLGVSREHMSVIFKQRYGMPPIQYLNLIRIQHAEKMLRETDMPIIEIAGELGFDSLSAFYTFFRKYNQMSPGEFRRKHDKHGKETDHEERMAL